MSSCVSMTCWRKQAAPILITSCLSPLWTSGKHCRCALVSEYSEKCMPFWVTSASGGNPSIDSLKDDLEGLNQACQGRVSSHSMTLTTRLRSCSKRLPQQNSRSNKSYSRHCASTLHEGAHGMGTAFTILPSGLSNTCYQPAHDHYVIKFLDPIRKQTCPRCCPELFSSL